MDDANRDGLIEFYSSQADLLLTQYNNINQLLGPTHDWSHPGTHCELLLRDFLRRNLLGWMSVDKGYVYGRIAYKGLEDSHGPEADILIHNTRDFRPIYRLNDFVIVQPESVLGIIQVKRTLTESAAQKGLEQLGDAKLHLLELNRQRRMQWARSRGLTASKSVKEEDMPFVFGAVVAFEDSLQSDESRIGRMLGKEYDRRRGSFECFDGKNPAVYMLPDFIGSINGVVLFDAEHFLRKNYVVSKSVLGGRCVGLQWLLATITRSLFPKDMANPPFNFPIQEEFPEFVQVPEADPDDWPIPDA